MFRLRGWSRRGSFSGRNLINKFLLLFESGLQVPDLPLLQFQLGFQTLEFRGLAGGGSGCRVRRRLGGVGAPNRNRQQQRRAENRDFYVS